MKKLFFSALRLIFGIVLVFGIVSVCGVSISYAELNGFCLEDNSGQLNVGSTQGKMGQEVQIPVTVQRIPNGISSFRFKIIYDSSVLEYSGFEQGDLVTSLDQLNVFAVSTDRLQIEGTGTDISQGATGNLVVLKFIVIGGNISENNGCYPLQLENLLGDTTDLSTTGGCFCISPCNGDLNSDGEITPSDALIVFVCQVGSRPCSDCTDIDRDGIVTLKDALCIFQKYLGQPSCLDRSSPENEIPLWLTELIDELKNSPVANPPAQIIQYEYLNTTVYYLPPKCCDIPSNLYGINGNIICHPDGGFTGRGDGGCPDFFTESKNGITIWKDERNYPVSNNPQVPSFRGFPLNRTMRTP
ncbi:MAG: cohesin domain-containing protein [bacterium]